MPNRDETPLEAWPTSLLTLPAPVYQPLGGATTTVPPRRLALGCFAAAVLLASLALAFWQLYWFLESSERGRDLLDRAAAAVAAITDLF